MRGSHNAEFGKVRTVGIIPAHAGLTQASRCRMGHCWDHPRACGAHRGWPQRWKIYMGSSPRMRGSPCQRIGATSLDGIIPAHAGLTQPLSLELTENRDHPRACGAHLTTGTLKDKGQGSSPRMRGSLYFIISRKEVLGIIPAHAGLTLKNPNIDAILSGPHPIFYSVLRVIR